MLVITRKTREGFYVGEDVIIKILGVKGNQVRIGIDAPTRVIVDRIEVRERRLGSRNAEQANVDDGLSAA